VLRTPGLVSRENLKIKIIMEKKIKSVMLKTAIKPLPNYEICKGVTLNKFVEGFGFDRFEFKLIYPVDLIHRRKDLFEIKYEPEPQFVNVKIEYTGLESTLAESSIEKAIAQYFDDKVTADVSYIPEGTWDDEDMIEFVRYLTGNDIDAIKNHFNNFKAERKSELDK